MSFSRGRGIISLLVVLCTKRTLAKKIASTPSVFSRLLSVANVAQHEWDMEARNFKKGEVHFFRNLKKGEEAQVESCIVNFFLLLFAF